MLSVFVLLRRGFHRCEPSDVTSLLRSTREQGPAGYVADAVGLAKLSDLWKVPLDHLSSGREPREAVVVFVAGRHDGLDSVGRDGCPVKDVGIRRPVPQCLADEDMNH